MNLFRVGLTLLPMLVLFCCSRSAQDLSGIVVYGHEVRTVQLWSATSLLAAADSGTAAATEAGAAEIDSAALSGVLSRFSWRNGYWQFW